MNLLEELLKVEAKDAEQKAFKEALREFLASHIIIHRGENRHTDADVIHAYAEGLSDIEVLRKEGWIEFKQGGMCLCIGDSYRIKPAEPIYEWQWLSTRSCDNVPYSVHRDGRYFTDIESEDFDFGGYSFLKIDATKRERK